MEPLRGVGRSRSLRSLGDSPSGAGSGEASRSHGPTHCQGRYASLREQAYGLPLDSEPRGPCRGGNAGRGAPAAHRRPLLAEGPAEATARWRSGSLVRRAEVSTVAQWWECHRDGHDVGRGRISDLVQQIANDVVRDRLMNTWELLGNLPAQWCHHCDLWSVQDEGSAPIRGTKRRSGGRSRGTARRARGATRKRP